MKRNYDIFISYRKDVTGDKAELLWQILETSGFKGRVSYDKDNVELFKKELVYRIDHCKDLIILVFPDTFKNCSTNFTAVEFYRNLASKRFNDFINEIDRLSNLPIKELGEEIGWEKDDESPHLDFLRIEINRALYNAESNKLNIVPITLFPIEGYDFVKLNLPKDLEKIKDYQAVYFAEAKEERFNRVLPDLFKRLKSRRNRNFIYSLVYAILPLIIILFGRKFIIDSVVHLSERERVFKLCSTEVDYANFCTQYPNTKRAQQCQDSLNLIFKLKNQGIAYVNNAGLGYLNEKDKRCNLIDDIKWSPNISLLQLRTIKEILNRMMKIYVANVPFIMGQNDSISYDSPPHKVILTDNFYICQYEIKQGWWYAIMKDSIITHNFNYPISNVTYDEAYRFVSKLRQLTQLSFDLPTEAQWEWAAVSGTNYKYSGSNNAAQVAWYSSNSDGIVHATGMKEPNDNQLYDMSGNVAEWCKDYMNRYPDSMQINPLSLGKEGMYKRIVRGGSFLTNERDLNVRHRASQSEYKSGINIGFRIILETV